MKPYQKIWQNEIMLKYPDFLDGYPREWVEELRAFQDKETVIRLEKKEVFDYIKNPELIELYRRIVELEKLPQIPELPPLKEERNIWLYIIPKKQHEIKRLAPYLNQLYHERKIKNVVDIGGGIGLLAQILNNQYQMNITTIDMNAEFQKTGDERNKFNAKNPANRVQYKNMKVEEGGDFAELLDSGAMPEEFKKQFDFSKARARGEHNEANFFAAYEVLRLLNIPDLKNLFQEFINEFAGVAHRLEFVLEKNGLTLYNDAKSTNSLATTTAISAFKDSAEPLYLILGGKLRNETDKLLPDLLPYKGKIARIFTIGDVTERLFLELGNDFEVVKAGDLRTVFQMAKGLKGNLVFSPAFPSFDQFKNYVDRGEKFKLWAKEVF